MKVHLFLMGTHDWAVGEKSHTALLEDGRCNEIPKKI